MPMLQHMDRQLISSVNTWGEKDKAEKLDWRRMRITRHFFKNCWERMQIICDIYDALW